MFRTLAVSVICAGSLIGSAAPQSAGDQPPAELRDVNSFAGIADQTIRSRALFQEAAKVITSPRCMNCHPADDHPTQGNDLISMFRR
jgi:hypothetical protein